jgi:pimeloyl-ACP methyl ester carboxylesterase
MATPDGSQPRFVSFDGTHIHYIAQGDGFPVLLLHGFIVDGSSWIDTPLFRSLLDAGFRPIAPDLRGNGQSDRPHEPAAYERDAEARDVVGLVDALGVERYDVVGYSRGSIIATRVLLRDARVRRAVLGGMGADFTDPDWPRRKQFYAALTGQAFEGAGADLPRLLVHFGAGVDRQALALMQRAQPSTSPAELARIEQPVLVISGDQDVDNGRAADLARLLPKGIERAVPGTHTSTMRSAPFAREVVDFLRAE